MSRKGFWLLLAVGLAWGIPYLFIRVAVQQFDVATVILARVLIGAAILIPFAIRQKALLPALRKFKWVIAFALIEMVGPWFLITYGEKFISSGLAGLLVSTVPLWSIAIAFTVSKDHSMRSARTLIGFAVGFVGVVLLVGIDSLTGHMDLVAVGGVILATIGYAVAPAIADKKLKDVPSSGVMSLSMLIVAVVYAVPGGLGLAHSLSGSAAMVPQASGWIALAVLGVVCSALAFILFFALIREVGPTRATLCTYLNTAVAVALGVLFLGEPLTAGMILGFPMVLLGSYFATRKQG